MQWFKSNRVLDVSRMYPDESNTQIIDRKPSVEGLCVYSDNYASYKMYCEMYNKQEFAIEYWKKHRSIMRFLHKSSLRLALINLDIREVIDVSNIFPDGTNYKILDRVKVHSSYIQISKISIVSNNYSSYELAANLCSIDKRYIEQFLYRITRQPINPTIYFDNKTHGKTICKTSGIIFHSRKIHSPDFIRNINPTHLNTLFVVAAENETYLSEHITALKVFLELGIDINSFVIELDGTILDYFISRFKIYVVEKLLELKAKPDIDFIHNYCARYTSIEKLILSNRFILDDSNFYNTVKLLLKAGASNLVSDVIFKLLPVRIIDYSNLLISVPSSRLNSHNLLIKCLHSLRILALLLNRQYPRVFPPLVLYIIFDYYLQNTNIFVSENLIRFLVKYTMNKTETINYRFRLVRAIDENT